MGADELEFQISSGMIKLDMKGRKLVKALKNADPKLLAMIDSTMQYWAPRVESYMKTNASWTDRTGNARNGLAARAYREGKEAGIVLYHQVPYGIWLEVANSGRYAIINPTIESQGPMVMEDFKGRLTRMKF